MFAIKKNVAVKNVGPKVGAPKNLGPKSLVNICSVTAEIFLIWTNVAGTNVD